MKHGPSVTLFRLILSASCLLAALFLTSCAKKPFPLDEALTRVRPPEIAGVVPASDLVGVSVTVYWNPSDDDRYANRTIVIRPMPKIAERTQYYLRDPLDRPADDRVKYEIYRAEVEPGEDVYSLRFERFKWIGEKREGQTSFEDTTTVPRLIWWQAQRREVKKVEREAEPTRVDPNDPNSAEKYENMPKTENLLKYERFEGYEQEATVDRVDSCVLQKFERARIIPIVKRPERGPKLATQQAPPPNATPTGGDSGSEMITPPPVAVPARAFTPNGDPDVATLKALMEAELDGWALQDEIVLKDEFYAFQKDDDAKRVKIKRGPDGQPNEATEAEVADAKAKGWQEITLQDENYILKKPLAREPEIHKGKMYTYMVRFVYKNGDKCLYADSKPSLPTTTTTGIFGFDKLINLIMVISFMLVAGRFIIAAQRGKEMYIRPIAGIAAVEEAVGRATEMGRPALFCPGLGGVGGPATLASLAILSKIAEKTAEYQTELMMPNCDIYVLQIGMETIKEAYLKAGRPDAFSPDMAFFVSDRQFSYAAGVSGIIARRRPAAIFLLGSFFAEALLLAEAGANIGAIQIGGTDQDAQLPFFVTACDYTLIGEELYAAGAYLSRDPKLLGTLKAQDGFKAVVMALIIILVPLVVILTLTGNLKWMEFFKFFFDVKFLLM